MLVRNIGVVLVRLFCVYLAISAVQSLSYVIPGFFQFGYRGGNVQDLLTSASLWLWLTSILLPAIVAIWLWRNADSVLPADTSDGGADATASEIMLIGLSLLGLYLLVWGVVSLVRVETTYSGPADMLASALATQRLSHLVQIAIAVLLLWGRGRLSGWLLKTG